MFYQEVIFLVVTVKLVFFFFFIVKDDHMCYWSDSVHKEEMGH